MELFCNDEQQTSLYEFIDTEERLLMFAKMICELSVEDLNSSLNQITTMLTSVMSKDILISSEKLEIFVEMLFEKAVGDPVFALVFVHSFKDGMPTNMFGYLLSVRSVYFSIRKLFIAKCQGEFENNLKLSCFNGVKQKSIGTIRIISEAYKMNIVGARFMHKCIKQLIKYGTDVSLECLCQLLTMVGPKLDHETRKFSLCFHPLGEYLEEMEVLKNTTPELSDNVSFLLNNVFNLWKNDWKGRDKKSELWNVIGDEGSLQRLMMEQAEGRTEGNYPGDTNKLVFGNVCQMIEESIKSILSTQFSKLPFYILEKIFCYFDQITDIINMYEADCHLENILHDSSKINNLEKQLEGEEEERRKQEFEERKRRRQELEDEKIQRQRELYSQRNQQQRELNKEENHKQWELNKVSWRQGGLTEEVTERQRELNEDINRRQRELNEEVNRRIQEIHEQIRQRRQELEEEIRVQEVEEEKRKRQQDLNKERKQRRQKQVEENRLQELEKEKRLESVEPEDDQERRLQEFKDKEERRLTAGMEEKSRQEDSPLGAGSWGQEG